MAEESPYFELKRGSGDWLYVENPRSRNVVAVLGVDCAARVPLVLQMRPPVGSSVLELPAGTAESENLALEASREFEEETGLAVDRLRLLFRAPVSAGLCSSLIHVFFGEVPDTGLGRLPDVDEVVMVDSQILLAGRLPRRFQDSLVDHTLWSALFQARRHGFM
jgi:ADP-ribose pyrophosphatase